MADDKNDTTAIASHADAIGENPSLNEPASEGPASLNLAVGPPSPLTGCYLLIVIGEPYSQDHKDIILQKLLKGELICLLMLSSTRKFFSGTSITHLVPIAIA